MSTERTFTIQAACTKEVTLRLTETEVRELMPDILWDPDMSQGGQIEDLVQSGEAPADLFGRILHAVNDQTSWDVTYTAWED